MFAFYFLFAIAVLVGGINLMSGSPAALAGGRIASVQAVDARRVTSVRPGLETAVAESLVRRHAAAVSYAIANPAFSGQLADATLVAANGLPSGWSNLGGAVSNIGGNVVITWPATAPGGVTQGRLLAALAAGWGESSPRTIGRLSATAAAFAPLADATLALSVPAGAAPLAGSPALRTQVR